MDKKNEIQEVSTVEGAVSKISSTYNGKTEENFLNFIASRSAFEEKNIPIATDEAPSDGCKSQKVVLSFSKFSTDKLLDLLQESLTDLTRTEIEEELTTRGVVIQKEIKLENNLLGTQQTTDIEQKTEETKQTFFENACAAYNQGKYDEARKLFQNEVDIHPYTNEAKISYVQLRFLKSNPSKDNVVGLIFFFSIMGIFKAQNSSAVTATTYFFISMVTLYWIYYSFRWPSVFQAKQKFGSAIGWLWFIGFSTVVLGVLEVSHISDINTVYVPSSPPSEDSDRRFMLGIGLVILTAAYFATKATPFAGMIIFFLVSIAWAFDTASVLSVVALSLVTSLKLGLPIYTSAILHLIALYSIIQGIGACRGMDALSKAGSPKRLSDTSFDPFEVDTNKLNIKYVIFIAGAIIIVGILIAIFLQWLMGSNSVDFEILDKTARSV